MAGADAEHRHARIKQFPASSDAGKRLCRLKEIFDEQQQHQPWEPGHADDERIDPVEAERDADGAAEKVEQKQRKLTEFEKYSARMFLNGIIDSYFAWKEACPDEKKRDIYEFIGYASRVADNACSFIGIE